MIGFEEAHLLFTYDAATGSLKWRHRPASTAPQRSWNTRYGGKEAGRIGDEGYVIVNVRGKMMRAHRIGWLMHHGDWPPAEIDHRNLVRHDNRIENLRPADRERNSQNGPVRRSGFKGVEFRADLEKPWRARVCAGRKRECLGYYRTEQEAHAAYLAAAKRVHGEFARAA